ncbi:alpha/beta fold hydrolase [Isobaculum melis]|uniref:Pimeloyl-ACP methyl ester carboxylesterase n=1 Tax=Isobaculum melis TaxID=142588 RepID=A0A1H9UDB1_9LACT|nr:alpha/beta hydrolase [Isobaculum melis]SES07332.1 Pimeloyl-ACP methyl ester carboxylesterase [Isobaculum melis]
MKHLTKIKKFENINGVEQGMFLHFNDMKKPILLFLHGGPGNPEYLFFEQFETGIEQQFNVCFWEQRGAGLSYHKNLPAETINFEQLIEDTLAVTKYLKNHFQQEKIYLMGHSWGTYLGIEVARRFPEHFHAYIGVSQVANTAKSEVEAYHFIVDTAKQNGETKVVRKMALYAPDQETFLSMNYFQLRSKYLNLYGGGIMHQKFKMSTILFRMLGARFYTLKEKINMIKSIKASEELLQTLIKADLTDKGYQLEVPVYLLQGKYDKQTSYLQAKKLFEQLEAPAKQFYTFEQAAHSPMFEESPLFQQILSDIVVAQNEAETKGV